MKQYLLTTCLFFITSIVLYAQDFGFGFQHEVAARNNFNIGQGYDQSLVSRQNNFYFRKYSNQNKKALKYHVTHTFNEIDFRNYTNYMVSGSKEIMDFNSEAKLSQESWKFGIERQKIWHSRSFLSHFAINYGLFYEVTGFMERQSDSDDITYVLRDEINKQRFIFSTGFELKYRVINIGYKFEKPFKDIIRHDVINELQSINAVQSELRGLRLDQSSSYFFIGLAFDF
ncbi:MAG: hypothetical protein JXA77_14375 [Bacteroidales bacterium]|nr:hypothetical protein [Bacteroidales bacterium]MBN2821185.1 hypothetical protein [Bacteroidales bacterium]